MPQKAQEKVYQELELIFKASRNGYSGCGEHAFHGMKRQRSSSNQRAQAIENYCAKQGIAVAVNAILSEIAGQLRSTNPEVVKTAMERFARIPKRARDKVYQELDLILKASNPDYSGCAEYAFQDKKGQSSTPMQKARAIENYLAKQGIATAADPAEHKK